MPDKEFYVKFWGVRGSVPVSGRSTCEYGGNTSCLEIRCGDRLLMLDAGSGAFLFGESLKSIESGEIDVLFSHCHYDHIEGAPFFAPVHRSNWKIRYWSGHMFGTMTTAEMIETYMRRPYFPVGPEVFSAKIKYRDFSVPDQLKPVRGVKIDTISLNHHDGCVGYRINFDGRSLCLISDTTHIPGVVDHELIDFVSGTDLMIYDATYTDREFPKFWNFGHSTWEEGVRISKAGNVKRYCIFHHRPSRNDRALDKIGERAKRAFKNSYVASEGLVIKL